MVAVCRSPVLHASVRFLQSGTRRFEPASGDGSEDKASDVRQVGHASGLRLKLAASCGECCGDSQVSQKKGEPWGTRLRENDGSRRTCAVILKM